MECREEDLLVLQDMLAGGDEKQLEHLLDGNIVAHIPGRTWLSGVHQGRVNVLRMVSRARHYLAQSPYTSTLTNFSTSQEHVIIARTLRRAVVNGNPIAWAQVDLYFHNDRQIIEWRVFTYTTESFEAYWTGMRVGANDDLANQGYNESPLVGGVTSPGGVRPTTATGAPIRVDSLTPSPL